MNGTYLGRGWGGSSQQTRMVSECGPICSCGRGMNQVKSSQDTFMEVKRAVPFLATESGRAWSKRFAICSGNLWSLHYFLSVLPLCLGHRVDCDSWLCVCVQSWLSLPVWSPTHPGWSDAKHVFSTKDWIPGVGTGWLERAASVSSLLLALLY